MKKMIGVAFLITLLGAHKIYSFSPALATIGVGSIIIGMYKAYNHYRDFKPYSQVPDKATISFESSVTVSSRGQQLSQVKKTSDPVSLYAPEVLSLKKKLFRKCFAWAGIAGLGAVLLTASLSV